MRLDDPCGLGMSLRVIIEELVIPMECRIFDAVVDRPITVLDTVYESTVTIRGCHVRVVHQLYLFGVAVDSSYRAGKGRVRVTFARERAQHFGVTVHIHKLAGEIFTVGDGHLLVYRIENDRGIRKQVPSITFISFGSHKSGGVVFVVVAQAHQ